MKTKSPSTTIPFFGTGPEMKKHGKEWITRMAKSISTGQFLQGKEVTEFENSVAALSSRKFGVAVNSCTDALFFALVAAGVKPGDHVLVTDFSFIASASCILRAGAVPVFVDIDETYNMDLEKAQALVTPDTKALIMVHLYGQMADPEKVEAFARDNHLALIEDAAQAIGAKRKGRMAGSLGLASCISFDPTKPIAAIGSGGVVLTDDEAIAKHVRRLRYHGRGEDRATFQEVGFNSQMPTAVGAVLAAKLRYNSAWLKKRREIAARYVKGLSSISELVLPEEVSPGSHIYHKFVIRHPKRDALKNQLTAQKIETMVHYAQPLHKQPCFSSARYDDRNFPMAIAFSSTVLSLPIHPFLSNKDVDRVIGAIRSFAS